MKGKAIIPLVLGLVLGLVAVKFGIDTLRKAQASNAETKTITVVQATGDIKAHEEISAELVKLVETTDSPLVPATSRVSSIDEVVGRVTAKAIPQHAPILQSMLAPPGTKPGMVGRIPSGFRAVSVRIDEVTGVAGQVNPGDWVDVLVVMDVRTGGGRGTETIAEVILQHVQVAAIGRSTGAGQGQEGPKARSAKSATLLVAEEDVPKLHLAATRGKLTLAMRGSDDQVSEHTSVARSDVFAAEKSSQPAPVEPVASSQPVPLAPQLQPVIELPHGVTVYHGGANLKIERFIFENGNSRTILALSEGPTSGASSMIRSKTDLTGESRDRLPARAATGQPDDVEASDVD